MPPKEITLKNNANSCLMQKAAETRDTCWLQGWLYFFLTLPLSKWNLKVLRIKLKTSTHIPILLQFVTRGTYYFHNSLRLSGSLQDTKRISWSPVQVNNYRRGGQKISRFSIARGKYLYFSGVANPVWATPTHTHTPIDQYCVGSLLHF